MGKPHGRPHRSGHRHPGIPPPLVLVSLALTGRPWPTVPAPAYLAIAGTTTALAVTAALATARIVLRTPPARTAGPGRRKRQSTRLRDPPRPWKRQGTRTGPVP
jgi:hypothetical protein